MFVLHVYRSHGLLRWGCVSDIGPERDAGDFLTFPVGFFFVDKSGVSRAPERPQEDAFFEKCIGIRTRPAQRRRPDSHIYDRPKYFIRR